MQATQKYDSVATDRTRGPRIPRPSHSVLPVISQTLPAAPSLQMHCSGFVALTLPFPLQLFGVVVVEVVMVVAVALVEVAVVEVAVVEVAVVEVMVVVKVHLPPMTL